MKRYIVLIPLFFALSRQQKREICRSEKINRLAEKYVRPGLTIGRYDNDFVDAYYGPDSLKPAATKQAVFPKDSLLKAVNNLMTELKSIMLKIKKTRLIPGQTG
jgi:hypothetical protein